MNRTIRFLLFIFPFLVGTAAFIFVHKSDYVIWPSNIRKGFYSDSVTQDKGNSGIRPIASDDKTLKFEYILGDKYEFPYVGATFELEHDTAKQISDLSSYDFIEIELEASLSKRIPVVINQDIPDFSTASKGWTFRPLTKELIYEKGKREYELKLSDFQTPSWWFTMTKLNEKEVGNPDYARAHSVQLHNCQVLPKNVLETFTIYRIAFKKDMSGFWNATALLFVIYFSCLLIYLKFGNPIKLIFPRKELEVGNMADEDTKKVLNYIAEHYSNAELSLEVLQKDLGMSEGKISQVIKDVSDMSFKKYLNTIRLDEAKRLLSKTDRQVMDIAYKVGYGNVTHFNRVFKEAEGCSPNEFRKTSSK